MNKQKKQSEALEETNIWNDFDLMKSNHDLIRKIKLVVSKIDQDNFVKNFEESIDPDERKRLGQFFTSDRITEFIISKLELDEKSLILDPSCGAGSFLHSCFDYMVRDKNIGITKTLSNIYGIEINEKSLQIAKASLLVKSPSTAEIMKILNNNLILEDFIKISKKNIFSYFSQVKENDGFDAIIGNPPYLTLTIEKHLRKDPVFSKIICGQINATTLMIGRAFELLKPGGKLGLLLPKTLLRVNSYKNLREFLISNFRLDYLIDVGQEFKKVRGEQVILIATKMHKANYKLSVGRFPSTHNNPVTCKIGIDHLTKFNGFTMFNEKSLYELASKIISKHPTLEECCNGKIFRGISISSNSKFISKIKQINFLKTIRGDSIKKCRFDYFLWLQNRAHSKIDYVKTKKIVAQNIFSSEAGIIANYDSEELVTLDTVTNILPQNEDPLYILGIMNSELAKFFMVFVVYNQSRLTMHTDKSYIGRLPIPNTDNRIKNKIIKIVRDQMDGLNSDKSLDSLVYDAFNLTSEERDTIKLHLKLFKNTR